MAKSAKKLSVQAATKSLKYSVVTKVINFDANKYHPRIIVVDGLLAIRLKGRNYTKA